MNLWTSKRVNRLINQLMTNEKEKNYVTAGDTDSAYFSFDDLVKQAGMDKASDDEIADFLDTVVKEVINPEIDSYTDELCDYMNNMENKMVWGREAIAKSAIFCAKKRYAMLVIDNEGVRYSEPRMKIVGLESKKSNTPSWSRPLLEECYLLCLNQQQSEFYDLVSQIKKKVYTFRSDEIAIPSGVNGIENYMNADYTYRKGTPKHVKAAIIHNRLLKQHGLKHIEEIKSGGNLKYVTLKLPNPIQEEVIGFEKYLPEEFGLESYVDYNEAYVKGFEEPLKNFIDALGWEIEPVVSLF